MFYFGLYFLLDLLFKLNINRITVFDSFFFLTIATDDTENDIQFNL